MILIPQEPTTTLLIRAISTTTAETVGIGVYGIDSNGRLWEHSEHLSTTAAGSAANLTIQLKRGSLLGVALADVNGAITFGQVWASATLLRVSPPTSTAVTMVCAGFVALNNAVCYPSPPTAAITGSDMVASVITIADPAAGANFTHTVPTGIDQRIVSLSGLLVTSATVATRQMRFTFDDATNIFAHCGSTTTTSASQTNRFGALLGGNQGGIAGSFTEGSLPNIWLPPGFRLNSAIGNIQVGDQLSGIFLGAQQRPTI